MKNVDCGVEGEKKEEREREREKRREEYVCAGFK